MSPKAPGRLRSVTALLLAAVLGWGTGASAAPRAFVATDPSGDVLTGTHGDLTRLTLGSGRKSLLVQLDLADAVDRTGSTAYEVDLSFPGCSGGFRAVANPGVPSTRQVSCQVQPDDLTFTMPIAPVLRGTRLTWVVPFDDFPGGALSAGQVVRRIRAFSALDGALVRRTVPQQVHDDDLTTARTFTLR